jgi:hypothetical protein
MKVASASKLNRKSGVRWCEHLSDFLWGRLPSMKLPVKVCGIPHLAKNERDVGHPGFCGHARV